MLTVNSWGRRLLELGRPGSWNEGSMRTQVAVTFVLAFCSAGWAQSAKHSDTTRPKRSDATVHRVATFRKSTVPVVKPVPGPNATRRPLSPQEQVRQLESAMARAHGPATAPSRRARQAYKPTPQPASRKSAINFPGKGTNVHKLQASQSGRSAAKTSRQLTTGYGRVH